ncbi:uncharacterized protein Dyak_GE28136 [Drosophila yakuba]|uniref:Uncharacterized protein n=1 Tax=Drosophila yakuba TaxID=7245 RepID=A0A0R1DX82_DROYA|nr:uncharacterized protein Dyak_GE28136 [Drosophila yakuba]
MAHKFRTRSTSTHSPGVNPHPETCIFPIWTHRHPVGTGLTHSNRTKTSQTNSTPILTTVGGASSE